MDKWEKVLKEDINTLNKNEGKTLWKIILGIATTLNLIYLIAINTLYIQLPVPSKIYLRDIKGVAPYNYIFRNVAVIIFIFNILLFLVYYIKYIKKEK